MKIRLLAFASAGDALGAAEMDLELADGSRVSDLRARLDREHPKLAPLWSRLAVAMDGRIGAFAHAAVRPPCPLFARVALCRSPAGASEG